MSNEAIRTTTTIANLADLGVEYLLIVATLPTNPRHAKTTEEIHAALEEDGCVIALPEVRKMMWQLGVSLIPVTHTANRCWYWRPVGDMRDRVSRLFRERVLGLGPGPMVEMIHPDVRL